MLKLNKKRKNERFCYKNCLKTAKISIKSANRILRTTSQYNVKNKQVPKSSQNKFSCICFAKFKKYQFCETSHLAISMIHAGIYCGFTSNNQLEKYAKSLKQIAETERKNWYLFLLYPTSIIRIHKNIKNNNQVNVKIITYEALIKDWETIKIMRQTMGISRADVAGETLRRKKYADNSGNYGRIWLLKAKKQFNSRFDKLKLISALSLCYRGRMRSRGIRLFISILFVYRG